MSYDLLVLDLEDIPTIEELFDSIEHAATGRPNSEGSRTLTRSLASFLDGVRQAFPSLEADPVNSPWSVTPSGQADLDGRCLSFAVGKAARLFDVLMEFEELAWRHDLIICDPQEATLRRPRHD